MLCKSVFVVRSETGDDSINFFQLCFTVAAIPICFGDHRPPLFGFQNPLHLLVDLMIECPLETEKGLDLATGSQAWNCEKTVSCIGLWGPGGPCDDESDPWIRRGTHRRP